MQNVQFVLKSLQYIIFRNLKQLLKFERYDHVKGKYRHNRNYHTLHCSVPIVFYSSSNALYNSHGIPNTNRTITKHPKITYIACNKLREHRHFSFTKLFSHFLIQFLPLRTQLPAEKRQRISTNGLRSTQTKAQHSNIGAARLLDQVEESSAAAEMKKSETIHGEN